jgi:NADH:ubiquinone oxidoreductase subunit K
MTDPLAGQLAVGAILFALGAIGFLTRRNLILMMLSAEMMLHGVSINLTAFGRYHGNASGQVFTIFVLTIAACEAGLALALILNLYSCGATSASRTCRNWPRTMAARRQHRPQHPSFHTSRRPARCRKCPPAAWESRFEWRGVRFEVSGIR